MLEDVSSSWLSTPFHIYIVVGFFIWGLFMLAFSIRRAECKHPVILAVFSFFMWASASTLMVINGSLVKFLGEIHPSLFKYGPLMKQHLCFLGMCSGSAIFIAYLWGIWCILSIVYALFISRIVVYANRPYIRNKNKLLCMLQPFSRTI